MTPNHTAQGASGLAEGFRLLLNEAMLQERTLRCH